MKRIVLIATAALGLTIAGCRGETDIEVAPTDEVDTGPAVEEVSADSAICEALAGKHAEQIKQIGIIDDQLERAGAKLTALEYSKLGKADFKTKNAFAQYLESHQAKVAEAQQRIDEKTAKVTDGIQKEARTRAEMKRQGCKNIPEPYDVHAGKATK